MVLTSAPNFSTSDLSWLFLWLSSSTSVSWIFCSPFFLSLYLRAASTFCCFFLSFLFVAYGCFLLALVKLGRPVAMLDADDLERPTLDLAVGGVQSGSSSFNEPDEFSVGLDHEVVGVEEVAVGDGGAIMIMISLPSSVTTFVTLEKSI